MENQFEPLSPPHIAVLCLAVNPLLGSNYMFLQEPPDSASPFFFAPWPYYIPLLAGVGLLFFLALLAPFEIAKRWPERLRWH